MADSAKHIVIIGGGIIGCSSAYFLTRHPSYDPSKHKITVLEASKIAGGASGKAGGLLALWAYPEPLVTLSYALHKQLAEEHNGRERWGYREIHCGQIECEVQDLPQSSRKHENIKAVHSEDTYNDTSLKHVSLGKRDEDAITKLRKAGVPDDLDWINAECIRAYDKMGDPNTTAQVHPYQFTTSMAELAKEAGVKIIEHAQVQSIDYSPDGKFVNGVTYLDHNSTTPASVKLPATDIILAAGPWTSTLLPNAPISGTRAHSVTIRPSEPVSAYALFTEIMLPPNSSKRNASQQTVSPEIYARANEIYACGEGDHLVPLPAMTSLVQVDESRCQNIIDYVYSTSDNLKNGQVLVKQACYLPNVTKGRGEPLIGPTNVTGLWLCAGHTCWGIQNGPGTGKIMSDLILGNATLEYEWRKFDPKQRL